VHSTQTACPVRSAPSRRVVSTATIHGRWLISRGPSTACACSSGAQSGFVRIPLRAAHLHRTAAYRGRLLGPAHPAAGQRLVCSRRGPGGTAGVHLGHQWDLMISRNTLLRGCAACHCLSCPRPGCSGWMTGAAETADLWHDPGGPGARQPVALLPDRAAETVAQWLWSIRGASDHRDRSTAYAEGAAKARPRPPGADGFICCRTGGGARPGLHHTPDLDAVNAALRQQAVVLPDGAGAIPVPPGPRQSRAAAGGAARPAGRPSYDECGPCTVPAGRCPLLQAGGARPAHDLSLSAYADVSRAAAPQHVWGGVSSRPRKPICSPAGMRVPDRDAAVSGTPTARLPGSYALVAAYTSRLRQAQGLSPGAGAGQTLPAVAEPARPP